MAWHLQMATTPIRKDPSSQRQRRGCPLSKASGKDLSAASWQMLTGVQFGTRTKDKPESTEAWLYIELHSKFDAKFTVFIFLSLDTAKKLKPHWSFTLLFQASHYEIRILFLTHVSCLCCLFFQVPSGTPVSKLTNSPTVTMPPQPIFSLCGFEWTLAISQEHCRLVRVLRALVVCSNPSPVTHRGYYAGQGDGIFLAPVSTSVSERERKKSLS